MTTFTVNNKEYSHRELNTLYDFFTKEQWVIIECALDEYQNSGEALDIDVNNVKEVREVMYELARCAY